MKELKAYAIIDPMFDIPICSLDVRARIKGEDYVTHQIKSWAIFGTRREANYCLDRSKNKTAKVKCITINI